MVKAQATTTDRSAITYVQQYRWHCLVQDIFDKMRKENTGLCRCTGKTFGEVMHHFICGLDEVCVCTNAAGNCYVIGSAGKYKHEKIIADSHAKVTFVRTGTVGGTTGPTIILVKGKH